MLTFFSLIFVFQFLQNSHLFFQDSSSLKLVVQIFSLLGLSYLPLIIPFCLLFGILFGHGRLSGQSEFTALASFGVTKFQLAQPAAFFTVICTLICLNSIHSWGPEAKFKSRSLESILKRKIAATAFQPGVFLTQIPGVTLYAEEETPNSDLKNVLIINEQGEDYKIFSKGGEFVTKSGSAELGINLLNGSIYSSKKSNDTDITIDFKEYFIQLFRAQQNNSTIKYINNRTSKQLKQLLKTKSSDKMKIFIELNKRTTFALSCVVFFVLACLFSLKLHNRSSKGSGFFLAIVIAIVFWIVVFTSEFFAAQTSKPYLMFAPLLLFALFSSFAYMWIRSKSII
jgi:lipopolysaccharide export LptBFGC system permease protein LptF